MTRLLAFQQISAPYEQTEIIMCINREFISICEILVVICPKTRAIYVRNRTHLRDESETCACDRADRIRHAVSAF